MVVAREIENPLPRHVERDVVVVGELVEKMAGIGAFIAAAAVVSAAHVGANADPLVWPVFPLPVGVETDGNGWRLQVSRRAQRRQARQQTQKERGFHACQDLPKMALKLQRSFVRRTHASNRLT